MTKEEKVLKIIERLRPVYPNARIELDFENPFQLLVATILAAQATDVSVNKVTPELFKHFPNPDAIVKAKHEEIDKYVTKIRFHNNKIRIIKEMCDVIVNKFDGKVPSNMADLDSLPGVARKTANVVLSCAFGKPEGIIVDTHMIRMSDKLGLSRETDPVKIEKDLMEIVPKEHWVDFPLLLILHGRHFCTARPHTCVGCPLKDLCPDMVKN